MAFGQQILDGTEHERQRSAEFVADVAEERGLRAVNLGQGFQPLSLFFSGARILDGGGDLPGDQFIERAVFGIELEGRATPATKTPTVPTSPREVTGRTIAWERRCCATPRGSPSTF